MENILKLGRKIIPKKLFHAAQPMYHFLLAFVGAIYYRFPSRKIFIVGVTGTKGKTTVTEIINEILEDQDKTRGWLKSSLFCFFWPFLAIKF